MKKTLSVALLCSLVTFAGCETVQRKFTPKRKTPVRPVASIYYQEGEYQKKYSNDYYYKTHYTLWKTWHDELMDNLGDNSKKVGRAAQEAVGHLQQMQQYLKPEKNAQLQLLINDLGDLLKKLDEAGRGAGNVGPLRTELERIRRGVGRDFYYDKVKNDLLADKVDLGDQTPEPPPAGKQPDGPATA